MKTLLSRIVIVTAAVLLPMSAGFAKKPEDESATGRKRPAHEKMDNERLGILIHKIDPDAKGDPGFWKLTVEGRTLSVITDERADRMRIILPVADADQMDKDQLYRVMQANFDSALDARYSIANNILWSAFIHPLGALQDEEFLSAVGQVINLAGTYGTSYSSGALIFRGGDSEELQRRELIDNLIKKGKAL